MTYRGHVKNGVVILDEPAALQDGDEVEVRPAVKRGVVAARKKRSPTLYEQFKSVIGKAQGLPTDLAENHDHYLHGRPRK